MKRWIAWGMVGVVLTGLLVWSMTVQAGPDAAPMLQATSTPTPYATVTPLVGCEWTTSNDSAPAGDWDDYYGSDSNSEIVLDTTTFVEGTGSNKAWGWAITPPSAPYTAVTTTLSLTTTNQLVFYWKGNLSLGGMSSQDILGLRTGNDESWEYDYIFLAYNSTGQISVVAYDGLSAWSVNSLVVDTWYKFEFEFDHANSGHVKVDVNDVTWIDEDMDTDGGVGDGVWWLGFGMDSLGGADITYTDSRWLDYVCFNPAPTPTPTATSAPSTDPVCVYTLKTDNYSIFLHAYWQDWMRKLDGTGCGEWPATGYVKLYDSAGNLIDTRTYDYSDATPDGRSWAAPNWRTPVATWEWQTPSPGRAWATPIP